MIIIVDITAAEAKAVCEKFPWLKVSIGNPHKRSSHKAHYMPEERPAMAFLKRLRNSKITEKHTAARGKKSNG